MRTIADPPGDALKIDKELNFLLCQQTTS